jgi:hypothetical protein
MDGGPHGPGFDAPLPVRAQQRWTLLAVCLAALALPLSFSAGRSRCPRWPVPRRRRRPRWPGDQRVHAHLRQPAARCRRPGRPLWPAAAVPAGHGGFTIATAVVCSAPTLPGWIWRAGCRALPLQRAGIRHGRAGAGLAGPARARVSPCWAPHSCRVGAGAAACGLLLQALGWRSVFAAGGVLTLVAFVLGARCLKATASADTWMSAACWASA